jgi:hypothetical protein
MEMGGNGTESIIYEDVMMTPEWAKQILSLNLSNNRNLVPSRVQTFSDAMRRCEWKLNGETVKMTSEGVLLDGQHRLHAVIRSGMTVPVTIAMGVPRDCMGTIDIGLARNVSHYLTIKKYSNSSKVAAMCGWHLRWLNRQTSRRKIPLQPLARLTPELAENMVSINPGILESASFIGNLSHKLKGMIATSLAAYCHFLFSRRDKAKADDFVTMLAKGTNLTENDSIYKLRERLSAMSQSRSKFPDYDYMAVMIRAWNLFVAGKKIRQKIYWHEASEDFPEPK